MRQRHFQLLGRSLDMNNLISQRQNNYIRQNLEYAISRFEASDLTSLVELEHQILNIQLTHRLMSQHFTLDPWQNISFLSTSALFYSCPQKFPNWGGGGSCRPSFFLPC